MEKSKNGNRTFQETEKLLYSYEALNEYVKDEDEYINMIHKKTSNSIVKFSKEKTVINEDERIKERIKSYDLSKLQIQRLDKALSKIKNRIGYEVIEYRYLKRKNKSGEIYSYEEIATILAGQQGYSNELNEKTVRRYKNTLIKEISICLFGIEAIQ